MPNNLLYPLKFVLAQGLINDDDDEWFPLNLGLNSNWKKSPGHSVFITVLLNEYFKQRKFPEFVINGGKEENEWIDATLLIDEKRIQVSILSQSALAIFCSADYFRSACAVFAANLENVDNWYIFYARMPYMYTLYIGPRLFLLRGLPLAIIDSPHLHPSTFIYSHLVPSIFIRI